MTCSLAGQVRDTFFPTKRFDVFFESGSSSIPKSYNSLMDQIAMLLNTTRNTKCTITGYTDSKGGSAFNNLLSRSRAHEVQQALSNKGVSSELMAINAKGEEVALKRGDNLDIPNERKVVIQLYEGMTLRTFTGQVIDDSTKVGIRTKVHLNARQFQDSTMTDQEGRFRIDGPEDEFAVLRFQKQNYVEEERRIKISKALEKYPLVVKLPALLPNRIIAFGKIYFYGNLAETLPRSERDIERLFRTLKHSDVCVEIRGHVNVPNQGNIPVLSSFFLLSEERATTIYNRMVKMGIDKNRMIHKGYGNWEMVKPKASTEIEMEQNRRVEIKVVDCSTIQSQ